MSNPRINFSGNSPWEPLVGYSRAVRVGNLVWVAGTTAINDLGELVGPGDPYAQTIQVLTNIQQALFRAGATLEDVVRTRIFVTNINNWEIIGRAHGQFFSTIRPVATMVEVARLIDPQMLVEIEVDAILPI